jgi:hypothetical protein
MESDDLDWTHLPHNGVQLWEFCEHGREYSGPVSVGISWLAKKDSAP